MMARGRWLQVIVTCCGVALGATPTRAEGQIVPCPSEMWFGNYEIPVATMGFQGHPGKTYLFVPNQMWHGVPISNGVSWDYTPPSPPVSTDRKAVWNMAHILAYCTEEEFVLGIKVLVEKVVKVSGFASEVCMDPGSGGGGGGGFMDMNVVIPPAGAAPAAPRRPSLRPGTVLSPQRGLAPEREPARQSQRRR